MEIWKGVIDFKNYEVSNFGNVRNIKTGKVIALPENLGYTRISLCSNGSRKNKTVHSLVMDSFVGYRKDCIVINHINGIKTDNRLENLEYCSQSHNRKEDFRTGRQSLQGEKNTQSKLTEKDVLDIIELRQKIKLKYSQIADIFGITKSGVSSIFNGYTWTHITKINRA